MKLEQTIINRTDGGYQVQVTLGDPDEMLEPSDWIHFSFLLEVHPEGSPTLAELQKVALQNAADAIRAQIALIDHK